MTTASTHTGLAAPDRAVLQLTGSDAREVLQGVVTNDVDAVAPGVAIYAALLTPQGKYLSDFFMLDGGDGAVLLDVNRTQAQALGLKLKMYCLRRDAEISVRNDLQVALIWGGDESTPTMPDTSWCVRDPRNKTLGWRAYGPDVGAMLGDTAKAARSDYDALRIALAVPEAGIELTDQTFILEAGLERLNGVDFRKGCYVGQEVTARMKHKTELRKGLVKVRVEGKAPAGTPILADGKPAGTLFTNDGSLALAHLRLDRAGPDMIAGDAKVHFEGT